MYLCVCVKERRRRERVIEKKRNKETGIRKKENMTKLLGIERKQ